MTYFLPINSTSLAHYFACACVKPARFFDNKPKDIQDKFPNVLLLSKDLGTRDTDCCLELVLTNQEEQLLASLANGFFLLDKPLPISRVKKVYFRHQQQLEQTLANINLSAAFVPHTLAKVISFSETQYEAVEGEQNCPKSDYTPQLVLYDRILGALALMKIAKEPYMNYSENYASTLSFFSNKVKDEIEKQHLRVNGNFWGLFSKSMSYSKYLPYLEKQISKEDLDKIALDNNQHIERTFTKAINYDQLSGMPYAFAILQSYGVGNEASTHKIDGLISNNFNNVKDGKGEAIALFYGYNRGYTVFSNAYGREDSKTQDVKYHLDSQLDYYAIESVYQFVFNSNTASASFQYIDEWCPRKEQSPKRKNEYRILDTVFVGKKKPSVFSKEYLRDVLAEVKTLDLMAINLTSLMEYVLNRIAADAKEEFEEDTEIRVGELQTKYRVAIAEVESLKKELSRSQSIISAMQQNAEIPIEVAKSAEKNASKTKASAKSAKLSQRNSKVVTTKVAKPQEKSLFE